MDFFDTLSKDRPQLDNEMAKLRVRVPAHDAEFQKLLAETAEVNALLIRSVVSNVHESVDAFRVLCGVEYELDVKVARQDLHIRFRVVSSLGSEQLRKLVFEDQKQQQLIIEARARLRTLQVRVPELQRLAAYQRAVSRRVQQQAKSEMCWRTWLGRNKLICKDEVIADFEQAVQRAVAAELPELPEPNPEPEPAAVPEVPVPEPEPAAVPEVAEPEPEPAAVPEVAVIRKRRRRWGPENKLPEIAQLVVTVCDVVSEVVSQVEQSQLDASIDAAIAETAARFGVDWGAIQNDHAARLKVIYLFSSEYSCRVYVILSPKQLSSNCAKYYILHTPYSIL